MSALTFIEHAEVTAATQGSIVFTSIPGTYTDLYLLISARSTNNEKRTVLKMEFNGASTNRSYTRIYGIPTAENSDAGTDLPIGYVSGQTSGSDVFGTVEVTIPNYTSSNHKAVTADGVSEGNITDTGLSFIAGRWENTSAITSIELNFATASFAQYSTATLYGRLAGSDGTTTVS